MGGQRMNLTDGTSSLQVQDDTQALRDESNGLLETARALVVKNQEDYQKAGAYLKQVKTKIREAEAARVARTKPINEALKLINEDYKGIKDQLEGIVGMIERPMKDYVREQDRIRQEAEAKARKEREEAEAKAREEADARAKELQAAQEAVRQAEDPFMAALLQEDADEALQATQEAIREVRAVESAPLCPDLPKVAAAGTRIVRPWKFRIVDPALIPREYLAVDEVKIGAYVRAMKESASIPGVETFQDITIGG
jgi:hypothetical protein